MKNFSYLLQPVIHALRLAAIILFLPACGTDQMPDSLHSFNETELPGTIYLFDLGVADINNDGFLDIFSTNHGARQLLMLNNAGNEFIDHLIPSGFSQNLDYPGAEPSANPAAEKPGIKEHGLYVYWLGSRFVVQSAGSVTTGPIEGSIQLPKTVEFESTGSLSVSTGTSATSNKHLELNFSASGDGQLLVSSLASFFAVQMKFSPDTPLDRIYIGPEKVNPETRNVSLRFRDRHTIAWADYNGDTEVDAFIARGGGSGRMRMNGAGNTDELLIQENGYFRDRIKETGIHKRVCPARSASWIDYDQDGLLDIYLVCGRPVPPRDMHPNQLHRQIAPGKFVDVAKDVGLALPGMGRAVWLDAENDGDMDIMWADKEYFYLYYNNSGTFERQLIGRHAGAVMQLAIADYDGDGDLDVFAASLKHNYLLSNHDGEFHIQNAELIGLPYKGYTANWVDFDNNGLIDIYIYPDGIFRQVSNNRFQATNLPVLSDPGQYIAAFTSWFDADNNGTRDLLIARKRRPDKKSRAEKSIFRAGEWHLSLHRNNEHENNWLQVDLVGPKGNRPAIGARVTVTSGELSQLQQVGQAEGSKFSQGHYRLYFGLGQNDYIDTIRVHWPDGIVDTLTGPGINQKLVIRHNSRDK